MKYMSFFKKRSALQCLLLIMSISIFASCSRYDANIPDTKANRKGFAQHLKVTPDKEVTDVYFFADEWGGDTAYWFAFSAPVGVVDKIVKNLGLTLTGDPENGFDPPVSQPLAWWNAEERKKSQYYEFRDEKKEILRCLWYHPETQKCQINITYW